MAGELTDRATKKFLKEWQAYRSRGAAATWVVCLTAALDAAAKDFRVSEYRRVERKG